MARGAHQYLTKVSRLTSSREVTNISVLDKTSWRVRNPHYLIGLKAGMQKKRDRQTRGGLWPRQTVTAGKPGSQRMLIEEQYEGRNNSWVNDQSRWGAQLVERAVGTPAPYDPKEPGHSSTTTTYVPR